MKSWGYGPWLLLSTRNFKALDLMLLNSILFLFLLQIAIPEETSSKIDAILKDSKVCKSDYIKYWQECSFENYVDQSIFENKYKLCKGKLKVVKKKLGIPSLDSLQYECDDDTYDVVKSIEKIKYGFNIIQKIKMDDRILLKVEDTSNQCMLIKLAENSCADSPEISIAGIKCDQDIKKIDKDMSNGKEDNEGEIETIPKTPSKNDLRNSLDEIESDLHVCIKKKKEVKIVVSILLEGKTGKVSKVKVLESSIKGKKTKKCIIDKIKATTFKKFEYKTFSFQGLFHIKQ